MRPLLALFVRALRQASRAPSTYLLRGGIALLVLLFLWSAHDRLSWAGAAGKRFFSNLVVANYFFVTLLGLGSFASAIAEEKEDGTLGLMRMADLSPLAILFGKSTSRLGLVFLLFVTQVPFAFLAVTLGGVSQTQLLTAFALLATYLFALANISLFFSVRLPHSSRAAAMTLGLIIGYSLLCASPYLISLWLIEKHHYSTFDSAVVALRSMGDWLWSVHPARHCWILAQGGYLSIELFRSVIVHLSVGLAFFLFSLLIFERCCGDESAYARLSGKPRRRWRWLGRPNRPARHAIAWKDFNFVSGGRFSIAVRCVLYGLIILMAGRVFYDPDNFREVAGFAWVFGLAMLHVELAIRALLMWGPEAWGQHIGSLIATPLGLRRIHWEKMKATLIAITPSIAVLFVAMVIGGSQFIEHTVVGPFRRHYNGPWGIPMNYWHVMQLFKWAVQFSLLLFLIVNLSLRLRWTALPAALGLFVVYQIIMGVATSFVTMRARGSMTWPIVNVAIVLGAGLAVLYLLSRNTHTLLLRRAAEG
jgi:hypothetical protein